MSTAPLSRVTPVQGRPLVYHCQSRKDPAVFYLVDLTEHEGNGSCLCSDWQCRCVANMKGAHQLFTDATLCYHLRLTHLEFMQGVLGEILAQ